MAHQTAGLKSLIKRRNNNEIVITVGDKDKRLCVLSIESYQEQGKVHTKGATKVWRPQIRPAQKRVTAVARNFSNIEYLLSFINKKL